MIHRSDNIGPAHLGFPERKRRTITQRTNLQPGIVAVTTTAAITSSAPTHATSAAIRDRRVMFSDIARGRSEVLV
jgi:hypothetical protein